MKEWTSVINEENLNNPYWNIYLYTFNDVRGKGFKIGKADSGFNNRYKNADTNGKDVVRLAHQDIVIGKDADTEIKKHFENDPRFEFKSKLNADSDETFFPVDGHTIYEAIEKFERLFKKENTVLYNLSKEELDTVNEIDKKNINVGYICPRYHKTALTLNLIDKRNRNFNIMISYAHTVKQSYINDVKNYGLNIEVVDIDEISKDDLQELLALGQKVLVVFFMTGTEDGTHTRRLSKLPNDIANVYIDEGDIGLATEISKKKIDALCKTIKLEKLFIASGTGLEKMTDVVKAFTTKNSKKLKPKELVRSYIQDVLVPRGDKATNIEFIKFRNTYPLLEKLYPDCVFENWNDDTIKNNRNSIENLLKMFFKQDDFFNFLQQVATLKNDFAALQRVGNLKSFVEKHFNKDAASIIFVGNKNETHIFIKDILTSIGVNAFIIDGNNTNGGDAEDYAKDIIDGCPNAVFIATNMANRSFSVSKIKNEIILMNDPAEASYTQKAYRIATNDDVFKTGYIWDFTLGSTDDNLFGIIKPELDRGETLGLTAEKVLEKILETKRVNFIFEALYNPDAFNETALEKLSSQLIMTTSFFDIKVDELAAADNHEFASSCVGQRQTNNRKGKGDRAEKTVNTHTKGEGPDEDIEEGPVDNRKIFKTLVKFILGSKTFFEDFDRNNIPNSFEDIGFHKDDIIYVYDTLCNNFGESLIKSKLNDSYKVISKKCKNAVTAYNLRTFDYNNFSQIKSWVSSWKKGDTVLALCLKSKPYIEYLKSCGFNVTVFENNDFNKDAITFKTIKDFVNIIKDMNFDHIIMNPPYDKNLHLKILQEAKKHSDDVVNLSPIRWLQDPLAEYKKNSDWKKFCDIRKKIESLDVVDSIDAMKLFDIQTGDLGIYHITQKGGFNCESLVNTIVCKILKVNIVNRYEFNKKDGWRVKISNVFGGYSGERKLQQKLICFKDGMKDGKPWYEFYQKNGSSKTTLEIPCSLKFDSEKEANTWIDIQHSKLGRYFHLAMRNDQNVEEYYFLWLPTYTHPWTDEMLYEYFDLTEDEVKEIEQEIK